MVDTQFQRARKLIEENHDAMVRIAEALLERESLDGPEVKALIEGQPLRPFRSTKGDAGKPATQEVIRPEGGVRLPPGLIDGERPQPA
jgi:cell division protease FtsH